jgi:hypothetical protein
MKGPMKLIDASSGLMECRVCASRHVASLQSGYQRADGAPASTEAVGNAAMNTARPTRRLGMNGSNGSSSLNGGS